MTKKYFKISKKFDLGLVDLLCYTPNESSFQGGGMKIEQIEIKDVGGVPYLKLDNIDPQMNIICGENGVGKTTILESIAHGLDLNGSSLLKKRIGSETGRVSFMLDESDELFERLVTSYEPNYNAYEVVTQPSHAKQVLYFKTNRNIDYHSLDSIRNDPAEDNYGNWVVGGVMSEDIKAWFISRDLYDKAGYLDEIQSTNIQSARSMISALDDSYSFSRVDTKGEIFINTPTGEVYFEYLSSGFKSAFFIMLGIIKELDYRFQKQRVSALDFNGIVLIDEVELHFHPEWQKKICNILKHSFPNIQFFVTTHSPHVIQGASNNEVVSLKKETGEKERTISVLTRDLPNSNKYGFQGWTIEEILTDVMGMSDTRSQKYNELIEAFDSALDDEDADAAKSAFNELEKMLHPSSHTKKLLKLQMAGLR